MGSPADGDRGGPGPGRARRGGAVAEAGRPGRADRHAGIGADARREVPTGGPRCRAGEYGGGDRAGRHQHERHHRAGPSRPGPGSRAERHDGAADAGAGRSGHPGQGRPGPGPGPRARLAADPREAGRVPVAGHRREGAGRLAGHRPGRHADHRPQRQGRSRAHVQDGLRLPPARGLAGQYRRVAGDAAAAGQRRVKHLRRPPHRADRGDPPDPRPDAVAAAGPRRRGRRQPRADQPPAVAGLPAPHRAVHLRLGDHRGR